MSHLIVQPKHNPKYSRQRSKPTEESGFGFFLDLEAVFNIDLKDTKGKTKPDIEKGLPHRKKSGHQQVTVQSLEQHSQNRVETAEALQTERPILPPEAKNRAISKSKKEAKAVL